MRLLADENIPAATVRRLRADGHLVEWAAELFPGVPDSEVLRYAAEGKCLLLTFDRDFGALVFVAGGPRPLGIVYLRFTPKDPEYPALVLEELLARHDVNLTGRLTVVDLERLRQRELP